LGPSTQGNARDRSTPVAIAGSAAAAIAAVTAAIISAASLLPSLLSSFLLPPLQGEYAARVHNLRSYDAISRDLLARWAYPFVPDTNVFYKAGPWGPSSYRYGRGHK
jgi:hypothetical protein